MLHMFVESYFIIAVIAIGYLLILVLSVNQTFVGGIQKVERSLTTLNQVYQTLLSGVAHLSLWPRMLASSFCFVVILITFIPGILSTLTLYLYPQFFYFRAWEYFVEVVNKSDREPSWHGRESGDLSREYVLQYQDSWETNVTTDSRGFRSNRDVVSSYPILFAGDSTIFGSGLSDNETLPWQLSEQLSVPVFNGGKHFADTLVLLPELKNLKIIIEGRTERSLHNSISGVFRMHPPQSMIQDTGLPIDELVPQSRFHIYHILFRKSGLLYDESLQIMNEGWETKEYLSIPHQFSPEILKNIVKNTISRSQQITEHGYHYLFIVIPSKQTFYSKTVDSFTQNLIPTLNQQLRAGGVATLDTKAILQPYQSEGLHFRTDSHMKPIGKKILAQAIAAEIRNRKWLTHQ